jgi:hypothetical protein
MRTTVNIKDDVLKKITRLTGSKNILKNLITD